MPITKHKKVQLIEELIEKIKRQKSMVFVDFTGLKVKDFANLRKKIKELDAELKVTKKTLLNLVFKKTGVDLDVKKLAGEIAVVFSYGDELAPIKEVFQFSKNNPNLKILSGFFEGEVRKAEEIISLAQLPSRSELLGKLVSSFSAPISRLVNSLQGNIKGLINVLAKAKTL